MPVTLRARAQTLVILAAAANSGCQSAIVQSAANAIGARASILAMTESEEQQLGAEAYREILASASPTSHREYQQLVERVGRRIAAASGKQDYDWEFTVLAGSTQNAFCLPGGKVAVYEGLLPLCENEAGLAVVMSHEVAHALARHGGERMRNQALADAVGEVIDSTAADAEARKKLMIQGVYGAATQVGVLLPFSRAHESEADSIGLILMARAGYDPAEAPLFWRRFRDANSGSSMPEIFSTHPADERRAADLENLLPQAEAYYKVASQQHGKGQAIPRLALATTKSAPEAVRATSLVPPVVLPPRNAELVEAPTGHPVAPASVELPLATTSRSAGAEKPVLVEPGDDPFVASENQSNHPPAASTDSPPAAFERPEETAKVAEQPAVEDPGWVPSSRQSPQIQIEGPVE